MTRVNCVPPEVLTDRHLVAEWKEIPRILTLIRNQLQSGGIKPVPETYRLGTGHMQFFADKANWILCRLTELNNEMINRGMRPSKDLMKSYIKAVEELPPEVKLSLWEPTPEDQQLNLSRLKERSPDEY